MSMHRALAEANAQEILRKSEAARCAARSAGRERRRGRVEAPVMLDSPRSASRRARHALLLGRSLARRLHMLFHGVENETKSTR
jgi:hypothetical protein